MKNEPLVSIIIPTFNYGLLITDTIRSIKAQTYSNWEIIIVDDGSTDHTKDVVSEYLEDPRIAYFYQENTGLSGARNTGISKARGQYIQFLDADDLISEHKLESQILQFENDGELGISYSGAVYFKDGNLEKLYKTLELTDNDWMPQLKGDKIEALNALIASNIMPVNAVLIKRKVVEAVGYFDTSLRSLEDWDYWFRCALLFDIRYLDDKLAYAMVRVHSSSMSQNRLRMLIVELELRKNIDYFLLKSDLFEENRTLLLNKNRKSIKSQTAYIIRNANFFESKVLKQLIDRVGLKVFAAAYLKAINDSRKH